MCQGLPIHCSELYQRRKARGGLVVPGDYFFFGLDQPWSQERECFRLNYSQPAEVVKRGIDIVAEEIARAYDDHDPGTTYQGP